MILVADDNEDICDFVAYVLRQDGYEVIAVDSGLKALDLLDSSAEIDLLLADIRMPEMDGIALALKVSKDRPNMPIVLMTGYAAEEGRTVNLNALVHDVIRKPFNTHRIKEAVAAALTAGRRLRDETPDTC